MNDESHKTQQSQLAVSVEEAERLLGIGRDKAYEGVHDGTIPSIQLGRRIIVPLRALERKIKGEDDSRAA